MSIPHPKGDSTVWTCVEDNSIEEKEECKTIGLGRFGYKLFAEEEGGGVREGLDGYPYLKHLIQLWLGYWVNHTEKMNEVVGMKNFLLISGGNKQLRLVCNFTRQEFCKCVGCIILEVTYGMKGQKLWSELPINLVRIHQQNYT